MCRNISRLAWLNSELMTELECKRATHRMEKKGQITNDLETSPEHLGMLSGKPKLSFGAENYKECKGALPAEQKEKRGTFAEKQILQQWGHIKQKYSVPSLPQSVSTF